MRFPRPPERIRAPAMRPRGCRTLPRSSSAKTARRTAAVTALRNQRIPEKLDQAAP